MEGQIEIDVNVPVSITLPAGQWAHVLEALGEQPMKIARPIADAINAGVLKVANPEKVEETDKPVMEVEPDKEQSDED